MKKLTITAFLVLWATAALATEQFKNLGSSTISAQAGSATTLSVLSASTFPSSGTFTVGVDTPGTANYELERVTAVSGTNFTVTRGLPGGAPSTTSHLANVPVVMVESAESFTQLEADVEAVAAGVGACVNQAVTATVAGAAPTCTTLTSAYVDNSIAKTGADINTSNQVTNTHLASSLPVAQGGTGLATLTAHDVYVGNGTSAPTAISPSTSTFVLTSNGTGADPSFQAAAAGINPIVTHTLTPSASVTLVVNSGTVAATDVDYNAASANTTYTFPASMADGEILLLDHQTSGTARTVTFAKGTLVTTFASDVIGDSNTAPGSAAACPVNATGNAWFRWQYTAGSTTATLLSCGQDPPPAQLGVALGGTGSATAPTSGQILAGNSGGTAYVPVSVSGAGDLGTTTLSNTGVLNAQVTGTHLASALPLAQGGTAQTAISGWPIATTTTTSVSGATNITPSSTAWITQQDITMTASATLTFVVPSFANQMEPVKVCQSGSGHTPTFAAGAGLTLTGTFPTCTTASGACCDFEIYFETTSTGYITGSNAGPL